MNGSFGPIQPGDLITAGLINHILDRLAQLSATVTSLSDQLGPGFVAWRLGELAESTHLLVALGTGFEPGGGIWLDGEPLLVGTPGRGINLVILDPELTVKHRRVYDTHGSTGQADQLAADLATIASRYDIIAGVTHDAYTMRLTQAARNALAAVGAAALGEGQRIRDNAAFIGVVPASRGNVQFNYLTAVAPADQDGTTSAAVSALPFAWGLYNTNLRRFLMGGAMNNDIIAQSGQPTATFPTATFTTATFPTATFPTATITVTFPTATVTTPTATLPTATLTATFPTATIVGPTATLPTATLTVTFPTGSFPTNSTFTLPFDPVGGLGGGAMTLGLSDMIGEVGTETESLADASTARVRGIGEHRAAALAAAGMRKLSDLADATPDEVAAAAEVNREQAADFIAEARNLLGRT